MAGKPFEAKQWMINAFLWLAILCSVIGVIARIAFIPIWLGAAAWGQGAIVSLLFVIALELYPRKG